MNEEKMKSFTSYMFHVMEELELEERFGTLHRKKRGPAHP